MTLASPFERPTLLPFLGLLRVEGPDAVSFLQGQLTHDLRLLADGRTLLAACCSPQGRVIALPRLRQQGGSVYALLPRELAEPLAARLRRFVLRARLRLSVADELAAVAVGAGDGGPAAGDGLWFDYSRDRRVLVLPRERGADVAGPVPTGSGAAGTEQSWLLQDIADGLPQVYAASAEAFVPQMLNLDLLDAISFTKGCYTGQEIVARTQHLGRIKRRLFRYRLDSGPPPAALAGLHRDGAKVAEVLMSAGSGGSAELLAVTSLEARDQPLVLADGRRAEPVPMAYEVT
jgi:folate-binding protein YgfZ